MPMQFFIIELTYEAPPEEVEETVGRHRAFLDRGYQQGLFLASGPQKPKTGGIIIAKAPDRAYLEKFLADDPFQTRGIATYRFIEFQPVKRHPVWGDFFSP